jgi:hypothetical protein
MSLLEGCSVEGAPVFVAEVSCSVVGMRRRRFTPALLWCWLWDAEEGRQLGVCQQRAGVEGRSLSL